MNIQTEIKELLEHLESGGKYYKMGTIESIDFIEAIGDLKGMARANAIDYLVRYDKKWRGNPVEQKKDLYKAIHHILYLARQVNEEHELPITTAKPVSVDSNAGSYGTMFVDMEQGSGSD